MRWLSHRVMTVLGWTFLGEIPDVPKMVIVGAPHTSNWDFVLFLAALHHYDIKVRFLGKHTLFRWPFGRLFRAIGGIAVDRSRPGGIVGQVKAAFDAEDRMILVITPEGTRGAASEWKSGFIEIAETAGVPVVFAGVDGPGRTLTIGPSVEVGHDRVALMDRVRAFYADKEGLRPGLKGPVRLGRESRS
ncbi:MAG: 1-acyl-sn-glycerol-3-phosphate acyltransferase [Acidimicrobiia bacterium]